MQKNLWDEEIASSELPVRIGVAPRLLLHNTFSAWKDLSDRKTKHKVKWKKVLFFSITSSGHWMHSEDIRRIISRIHDFYTLVGFDVCETVLFISSEKC